MPICLSAYPPMCLLVGFLGSTNTADNNNMENEELLQNVAIAAAVVTVVASFCDL